MNSLLRPRNILILVGVLVLASCGSSTSKANSSANGVTVPTSAATTATAHGGQVTVDVQAGEYFFKSPMTTFKVGVPYHFVVHNVGGIAHEFMLVQPIASGMMSMDEMDKMAMGHIEAADLQAHQTASVDVTFTKPYPSGTIEMACHIGQHYEKGMRLPIVVTS